MKTFTLYVREIRVVPVAVRAESLEEAKDLARSGHGHFQHSLSKPSDLCADEYFDIFGEKEGHESK